MWKVTKGIRWCSHPRTILSDLRKITTSKSSLFFRLTRHSHGAMLVMTSQEPPGINLSWIGNRTLCCTRISLGNQSLKLKSVPTGSQPQFFTSSFCLKCSNLATIGLFLRASARQPPKQWTRWKLMFLTTYSEVWGESGWNDSLLFWGPLLPSLVLMKTPSCPSCGARWQFLRLKKKKKFLLRSGPYPQWGISQTWMFPPAAGVMPENLYGGFWGWPGVRQRWKGFFFFFFLDGNMSTTLLLCDEAGFVSNTVTLLHGFAKTTHSK